MITNPKKLIIYTDGGARGNPGPAGIGIAIYDVEGKLVKKYFKYLGERTNNEAEYEAVIAALQMARQLRTSEVQINLDSELVARQLGSVYRVKNGRMQELALRVRAEEVNFKKISYRHVPREKNVLADKLVNEAIDKNK